VGPPLLDGGPTRGDPAHGRRRGLGHGRRRPRPPGPDGADVLFSEERTITCIVDWNYGIARGDRRFGLVKLLHTLSFDAIDRAEQALAACLDGEEVVHGEDIRRPLGLTRAYPQAAVVRSLQLQARTPASFGGAKELTARVRLTATDADLSIGDRPEVSGTALALLLAISGRRVALDDLSGPGAATLATPAPA
jgi:hypothetical protein